MRFIFATVLLVTGLAACDDNTPSCVPKTKAACFCETGEAGEKVCRDDGHEYDYCRCLPDAGVDAPVDSEPAASLTSSADPSFQPTNL